MNSEKWSAPCQAGAGALGLERDAPSNYSQSPSTVQGASVEPATLLVAADERLRAFQNVTVVPNEIIRDPELSPGAKTLWIALWSYCFRGNVCFPGIARIAQDLSISVPTAFKFRRELERRGLLKVTRRGYTQTNLYELFAPAPKANETSLQNDDLNMSLNHETPLGNAGSPSSARGSSLQNDDLNMSLNHDLTPPLDEEIQVKKYKHHHEPLAQSARGLLGNADEISIPSQLDDDNDDGKRKGDVRLGEQDDDRERDHDRDRDPAEAHALALLRALGDHDPRRSLALARDAQFTPQELADVVERLNRLNGIKNPPGWLRAMLKRGREPLLTALDALDRERKRAERERAEGQRVLAEMEMLRARAPEERKKLEQWLAEQGVSSVVELISRPTRRDSLERSAD